MTDEPEPEPGRKLNPPPQMVAREVDRLVKLDNARRRQARANAERVLERRNSLRAAAVVKAFDNLVLAKMHGVNIDGGVKPAR